MNMKYAIMLPLALALLAWKPHESIDGNSYPPECQRDLSDVGSEVITVSRESMDDMRDQIAPGSNARLYGYMVFGIIVLDETLQGKLREHVLHHERCHILVGPWH